MNLFYEKDDFGFKKLRKGLILKLSFTMIVLSLCAYITTGLLTNCAVPDVVQDQEFIFDEMPEFEIKEPPVIIKREKKPVRKFVRYIWRLEYRFTKVRYTTCYTGYDPGDPGHGRYANQKFADKLHLSERIINYYHNTVALCPEDKIYHEQLIKMPDGRWSHKWRVHIQGVHDGKIGKETDTKYFAVPRDRMRQSKRIDYLITQAGKYKDMKERVKNWKSLNRKVDFWEWTKYRLYSDGSRERSE